LTLCKDIPQEVLDLNCSDPERTKNNAFDEWLQCYGKLKKKTDKNGRTIWFDASQEKKATGKRKRENKKKKGSKSRK